MNWGTVAGLSGVPKFSDVMHVISPPSCFPGWGRLSYPNLVAEVDFFILPVLIIPDGQFFYMFLLNLGLFGEIFGIAGIFGTLVGVIMLLKTE